MCVSQNIDYWRFDQALDFMYSQMVNNAKGPEAEEMKKAIETANECLHLPSEYAGYWYASNMSSAYIQFFKLVRFGGDWDQKSDLRSLLNMPKEKDQYFPIRPINGVEGFELASHNEIFYDIWSNIHYGYVGSAIGFQSEELQDFANISQNFEDFPILQSFIEDTIGFGEFDPGDVISVDIGINLWKTKNIGLTKSDLHSEIQRNIPKYFQSQDQNQNGQIDYKEVNPVIGKLAPESHEYYDGQ